MTDRAMIAMLRRAMIPLVGAACIAAPAPAFAAGKTYTITMKAMKFGPVPMNLHVGDTILWVNDDFFRHTATAADKSFNVDLNPTKRAKTVLKKAGKIHFTCRFHPGMTGNLIVAK
jgi:plastocyanin